MTGTFPRQVHCVRRGARTGGALAPHPRDRKRKLALQEPSLIALETLARDSIPHNQFRDAAAEPLD
jgi:hypothetical protein